MWYRYCPNFQVTKVLSAYGRNVPHLIVPPAQYDIFESAVERVHPVLRAVHGVGAVGVACERLGEDDFVGESTANDEGVLKGRK
jgi:hypothetical protein